MIYQKKLTEILERIEKIETEFALVTNRTSVEFSAAGLLLALFPYFHYETAYIVKDPTKSIRLPDETMTEARKRILKEEKVSRYSTIDKLTFITPNDLREMKIIGGKRSNLIDLKRALEVLELAGAIIKTNSRIRLNPSLISAVDEEIIEDDYMMFIKSEFLDEEKAVKSIKRSNQFRLMVDFDRSRSRIKQNNK